MRSREAKKGTETPGWSPFWGGDNGCCCVCGRGLASAARAAVVLERRVREMDNVVNKGGRKRMDGLGRILVCPSWDGM